MRIALVARRSKSEAYPTSKAAQSFLAEKIRLGTGLDILYMNILPSDRGGSDLGLRAFVVKTVALPHSLSNVPGNCVDIDT